MSPTQAPNSLVLLFSALLLSSSAVAIGDYLCVGPGSQSCLAWSQDPLAQGTISATAVCQPDPVDPTLSYCGYAHAACSTGADCDYGSCAAGTCTGFLGDACTADNDCQAFFFCGTDGTCGGTGSGCNNGLDSSPIPFPDRQCTSNVCNLAAETCTAPPVAGMPLGSTCGNNEVCASGVCTDLICALAPSQGSRKIKRYVLNGSGPNVSACPTGQSACAVGTVASDGFECIDSQSNLEQCGGCVSDGKGQDCTAIHGVESVTCASGRCLIVSCAPGLDVSVDGSTCVASLRH